MKLNQKGFSALELILIVAVVVLIGVVGWLIYNDQSKTKATNQQNTTNQNSTKTTTDNDPYEGWKTYSDSSVALRYPVGWTVKDLSQGSGQLWTQIIAPRDDAIGLSDNPNATNKHIVVDIRPVSQSTSTTCREDCKVYSATSLSITKSSNAELVISDWDSQGYAQALEVVDDNSVGVGATTYKLGATIGGKTLRINGNVSYNTNSSFGWIADVPSFKKTQSFQALVKILNSVTVK